MGSIKTAGTTLEKKGPIMVKSMEYAVRGPLVIRASEIENELKQGAKKPFAEVIRVNLGDCHALGGQLPITFIRQVLALVSYPPLLEDPHFPEDAKARARVILEGCRGASVGSYTDSPGIEVIRRHVAQYITKRDGGVPCDWNDVTLCAGASDGIKAVMKIFASKALGGGRSGVMIPIPQYPLYSDAIEELDMEQVGYYLNEDMGWALDISELERSIREAKKTCTPRAIVVINPGNPTGQVLERKNIEDIIKFAYKENLTIVADEVYQFNVYVEGAQFHSFKKVMMEMGKPYCDLVLASFMSCSKGYMGECGLRGGYAEVVNVDPRGRSLILKTVSTMLCPTVIGQTTMDCVVNPPEPGEPSFDQYQKEKKTILDSLAKKAKLVTTTFNSIPGISCNPVQGAMYAFPKLHLSEKAMGAAKDKGLTPDAFYALHLLENTGICIVPGSGFGQKEGTFHFRTTILPTYEKLEGMMTNLKKFHISFFEQYS